MKPNFIVDWTINMCIRTTYYIFCMQNKVWGNPELLSEITLVDTTPLILTCPFFGWILNNLYKWWTVLENTT